MPESLKKGSLAAHGKSGVRFLSGDYKHTVTFGEEGNFLNFGDDFKRRADAIDARV